MREIRKALAAERGAVEGIVERAYTPWVSVIGSRPRPMDDDYAARITAGQVYVTGTDGPEGLIVLRDEDDHLVIDNVAVDPDRHGHGIGRALLAFAEHEARRRGLPAVRLFTHELMASNIALYTALGYAETERRAIPDGFIVLMRKPLKPAPPS